MQSKISLGLILQVILMVTAGAREYYVATDGDDGNPGNKNSPLRTIQRAADKMKEGDICLIRSGKYHEQVVIRNSSGTATRPIVFTAYEKERVTLDGSIAINQKWKKYKGHIYSTKIDQDIWQLFGDGKSMSSARWPNGNWNDGSIWDKSKSMAWPEKERSTFGHHFNKELTALDFSLADGGIIIVNSGSFKTYKAFIIEHRSSSDNFIYDTTNVKVHFSYRDRIFLHGYFLEGKLGLLDTAGEWFFEPRDKTLYLWPPNNGDANELEIRGKTQSYAFDVGKSSFIEIRGLNFFATTVRFKQSRNVTIEDCNFLYPSYSKRMLRDLSPTPATQLVVDKEFDPAENTVRNCVFEYMDGPAMEMNGVGNVIENCYMHDVDYSCTYKGGWTLNMIDAPELIFRRNTIHSTGASELFKAGVRNVIELNNLSRSGYMQNDGSMVQISVKQQDRSETRYNWVHHSVKQGLRFDNSNIPNSPWGENGRLHHNVAWQTDRIFFKGDKHFIYSNLCFDNDKNDLIISSNVAINGRNYETITRNNIANKISGHRTRPGVDYPLPGIADHNWDGTAKGKDVRSQLRDPDNLDFRPRADSDLIDAGVVIKGMDHRYLGKAPDIGPYEFGDENYWIPGYQAPQASTPVPPDGATNVKIDADLMWLGGYKAETHNVYFGIDSVRIAYASRASEQFKGMQTNNIFSPAELTNGKTYFWRIDAMREDGIIKGNVWQFTVEQ